MGATAVAAVGAGAAYLVSNSFVQEDLCEQHSWLIEQALAHGFERMDLPARE
jgi:hypothetical protein